MDKFNDKKRNNQPKTFYNQLAPVQNIPNQNGPPQKPFKFYAVIVSWYEGDIIEATVKNLYRQGVDTVFLIDNESPDNTTQLAVESGAVLYKRIHSNRFSDYLKAKFITQLINKTTSQDEKDRSWWLMCDADELPRAPLDMTIKEYIAQQDDRIRVVGGKHINHYPVHAPYNIPGIHPAEFQFDALQSDEAAIYCSLAHDKHNLIRFDRSGVDIEIMGGFHRFVSKSNLLETSQPLIIHHFNYRTPDDTLTRLKKLALPDDNGESRIGGVEFYKDLEKGITNHMASYIDRYYFAEQLYSDKRHTMYTSCPTSWKNLINIVVHDNLPDIRWYSEKELNEKVKILCTADDFNRWKMSRAMIDENSTEFTKQYEYAPHSALLEHHLHAAKFYALNKQPEKAYSAISIAKQEQPELSWETLKILVKKGIMGQLVLTAEFTASKYFK